MLWTDSRKGASVSLAEMGAKIARELEIAERELEEIKKDFEKVPKIRIARK